MVTETPAVAPLDENSQLSKSNNKDDNNGGDDKQAAARDTAGNNIFPFASFDNDEVEVDITDEHVCRDTKDKNKSLGTRRSSRQKRPRVLDAADGDDDDDCKKKRRRKALIKIDLTGVEDQEPILKPIGERESSTSKYAGVSFDQSNKKWQAKIRVDGKQYFIGRYGNEEDAAKDYARAVLKYKGGVDRIKPLKPKKIDLTGVEEQQLILKPSWKRGASTSSKYLGVTFDQSKKKWRADTYIDGKHRYIGRYDNEEDAAKDYARAVFKYRGGNGVNNDHHRVHKG